MIPDIIDADIERSVEVLRSGMLVQGTQVNEFESKANHKLGTEFSFLTSNGTSTMHLALVALGIGEGDEVIVPAFSYVATANVVELVKAKTVFVDISLTDCNIDVNQIERAITERTKAIIPVHEFGVPANMSSIMKIAKKYNIAIVEDAACAFGAKIGTQFVGSFGDFGSFSFHPRKAMTSGEGGLLTVKKSSHASLVKGLRSHGWNDQGECEWAGFNYRITDFQAALLNGQFSRNEDEIAIRSKIAQRYHDEITSQSIIKPVQEIGNTNSWQSYHIIFKESIRDSVKNELLTAGIQTSYGAQCIPMMKYYKDKYRLDSTVAYTNAKKAYENGLVLPIYSRLKKEDQDHIIRMINKLVP